MSLHYDKHGHLTVQCVGLASSCEVADGNQLTPHFNLPSMWEIQ